MTSRPAPANLPLLRAANRASVSTTFPRAMLMRKEPGFMASKAVASRRFFVSEVRGTAKATTSASGSIVSRSLGLPTRSIKLGEGLLLRRVPMTRIPKPCARCAISEPIPPKPTTSIVLPLRAID